MTTASTERRRPGRPSLDDRAELAEIRTLLERGFVGSLHAAAVRVARGFHPFTSDLCTAERLRRKYRKLNKELTR